MGIGEKPGETQACWKGGGGGGGGGDELIIDQFYATERI